MVSIMVWFKLSQYESASKKAQQLHNKRKSRFVLVCIKSSYGILVYCIKLNCPLLILMQQKGVFAVVRGWNSYIYNIIFILLK